jgi:uncharacterized protein YbaR (Trm112 family)
MTDQGKNCPNCGALLVSKARHDREGIVYRTRYVRLDPSLCAVIACPECKTELEVRRGKLIPFRKRVPNVPPAPPEAGTAAPPASGSAPEEDAREARASA